MLLGFSVATLDLSVITWCVRMNLLVANAQPVSSELKKGRKITFAVGKPVGKFKPIITPDTLYSGTSPGILGR